MEDPIRFVVIEWDYSVFEGLVHPRITKLFRSPEDANHYIQNRLIVKWRKILTQSESWQANDELLWILISFLDEDYQPVPITDAQILACVQKIQSNPFLTKFHFVQLKEVPECLKNDI